MDPKELPIIEHIEELRKRLIICAVFFVIALIAGFLCCRTNHQIHSV